MLVNSGVFPVFFGGKSTLETWSGLDQLDDWLQAEHAGASQILLPLGGKRLDQVVSLFVGCCYDTLSPIIMEV